MKAPLRALTLGIALVATCPAFAQDSPLPPLERSVSDGVFTDPYYGFTYAGQGLERRANPNVVFSGKLADGARVEIRVVESQHPMTGSEWLELYKRRWKSEGRKLEARAQGTTPFTWVRFVQKTEDGKPVQHGFAYYPRGHQVFIVHVRAHHEGDATAALIAKDLAGFELDPKRQDSFRLAAAVAKSSDKDPRSPSALIRAAAMYAEPGPNQNPDLAKAASQAADRSARRFEEAGKLDAETAWDLAFYGASIDLDKGDYKGALKQLEQCLPHAKELASKKRRSACRYSQSRAYAGLGRIDDAFQELTSALEGGDDAFRSFVRAQASREPAFEKMRGDARWKKLFAAPDGGGK